MGCAKSFVMYWFVLVKCHYFFCQMALRTLVVQLLNGILGKFECRNARVFPWTRKLAHSLVPNIGHIQEARNNG